MKKAKIRYIVFTGMPLFADKPEATECGVIEGILEGVNEWEEENDYPEIFSMTLEYNKDKTLFNVRIFYRENSKTMDNLPTRRTINLDLD